MRRRAVLVGSVVVVAGLSVLTVCRWSDHRRHQQIAVTMREMTTLRVALEAFAQEHAGLYPSPPPNAPARIPSYTETTEAFPKCPDLEPLTTEWLQPAIHEYYSFGPGPLLDAWGTPLICSVSRDRKRYMLVSLGSDRARDQTCAYVWPSREAWHDLIVVDETFVSAPDEFEH